MTCFVEAARASFCEYPRGDLRMGLESLDQWTRYYWIWAVVQDESGYVLPKIQLSLQTQYILDNCN